MTRVDPVYTAPVEGGFSLYPASQGDLDWVEANFREGERREADEAGEPDSRTTPDDFEMCWTVVAENGEVVGYFGVMTCPDQSVMSPTRAFCFMSCTAADRHKFAFVRSTRPIFRWVASRCPPWVTRFVSWPIEDYPQSVRWQEKVLRMRRVSRVPMGRTHVILLEITKEEIEKWEAY